MGADNVLGGAVREATKEALWEIAGIWIAVFLIAAILGGIIYGLVALAGKWAAFGLTFGSLFVLFFVGMVRAESKYHE